MKLYKYRSLAGTSKEYTKRILLNNELYFANPMDFNDPFEMRFKDCNRPNTPVGLASAILQTSLGICSLSTAKDDMQMWAYYADGHRGICIGFEASHVDSIFNEAKPVVYQHEFSSVIDNSQKEIEKVILTKCESWSHEKEWRIIKKRQVFIVFRQLTLWKFLLGVRLIVMIVK